jgi:hypothetical protein
MDPEGCGAGKPINDRGNHWILLMNSEEGQGQLTLPFFHISIAIESLDCFRLKIRRVVCDNEMTHVLAVIHRLLPQIFIVDFKS